MSTLTPLVTETHSLLDAYVASQNAECRPIDRCCGMMMIVSQKVVEFTQSILYLTCCNDCCPTPPPVPPSRRPRLVEAPYYYIPPRPPAMA